MRAQAYDVRVDPRISPNYIDNAQRLFPIVCRLSAAIDHVYLIFIQIFLIFSIRGLYIRQLLSSIVYVHLIYAQIILN